MRRLVGWRCLHGSRWRRYLRHEQPRVRVQIKPVAHGKQTHTLQRATGAPFEHLWRVVLSGVVSLRQSGSLLLYVEARNRSPVLRD